MVFTVETIFCAYELSMYIFAEFINTENDNINIDIVRYLALSIKNIQTRSSREMTSRKNGGGGGNVAKHWNVVRARYLPSLIALLHM